MLEHTRARWTSFTTQHWNAPFDTDICQALDVGLGGDSTSIPVPRFGASSPHCPCCSVSSDTSPLKGISFFRNQKTNVVNFVHELDEVWRVAFRGSEILSWKDKGDKDACILITIRGKYSEAAEIESLLVFSNGILSKESSRIKEIDESSSDAFRELPSIFTIFPSVYFCIG
jgi:hypothetical protein